MIKLNAEAMRLPSPAVSSGLFQPDGANLPWAIYELQQSIPERFQDWVQHIQTALPEIQSIVTKERPEDRARYIVVEYKNGLQIPSWLLSDGTLRMMALTLLAYVQNPAQLMLIEEPENGIHPRAIQCVMQSLSSVYESQIFCATHSPLVLSLAERDQLLCFSKTQEGSVDIVSGIEHPGLKNGASAVHLGDLFAIGVLG